MKSPKIEIFKYNASVGYDKYNLLLQMFWFPRMFICVVTQKSHSSWIKMECQMFSFQMYCYIYMSMHLSHIRISACKYINRSKITRTWNVSFFLIVPESEIRKINYSFSTTEKKEKKAMWFETLGLFYHALTWSLNIQTPLKDILQRKTET